MLQRTQIYLPEELRKDIDKLRSASGESLAEYVRKAMTERVENESKKKTDLKKLADEVVGSSSISDKEAIQWIKEIREERRLSDERLEKRWTEAKRTSKNNS